MSLTITPHWQNAIWYETDALLALLDLSRAGDTVFDVGANIGGISSMLSPKIGPSGKIIAFEASPRTIGTLHENMAGIHATNVHIVHAAVSDNNDGWLPFYYGHITNAYSLTDTTGSGNAIYVKSISLDAWVKQNRLVPDVIKMDIEGAEYLALMGFLETINESHPPFVLEVGNSAEQPHKLLSDLGYKAINLATYQPFTPTAGVSGHSNVLYTHPDGQRRWKYDNAQVEQLREVPIQNLIENASSDYSLPIGELQAGRYIIDFVHKDAARSIDDMIEIAVGVPNQILSLQIAPVSLLTKSALRLPVHVDRATSAYVMLKRVDSTLLSEVFSNISISKIIPSADF